MGEAEFCVTGFQGLSRTGFTTTLSNLVNAGLYIYYSGNSVERLNQEKRRKNALTTIQYTLILITQALLKASTSKSLADKVVLRDEHDEGLELTAVLGKVVAGSHQFKATDGAGDVSIYVLELKPTHLQ